MVYSSLVSWPDGVQFAMPLSSTTESSLDNLVESGLAREPGASGTVVEALMWLRIGRLEPAHGIVQEATGGIAAYVHGMLHRLEGDFWNANYWFRRARDLRLENRIRDAFGEQGRACPWDGGYDPVKFTDACERWHRQRSPEKQSSETGSTEAELQGIAGLEWEAVWENALNSLF